PEIVQAPAERRHAELAFGVLLRQPRNQHADAVHLLALLGARRQRPRRRTAEQRDERAASHHSITSSASASSLSGIVMPRRPLACQATKRRNGTGGLPYWAAKQ